MARAAPQSFFDHLDAPIRAWARLALALLVLPLLASYAFPLWRIAMEAPQYPKGLHLDIWSYAVEGGNDGHDIVEINTLNHYIGMHAITRDELRDIEWIPFALGALGLLALRAAAIGNVRSLVDLSTLVAYVSAIAFGRFVFMLYTFGHHLDPRAPVKVEGFMPVVIGSKKVANFMTHSTPLAGSALVGIFSAGIVAITLWHLWRGRRDALATRALSGV